MTENETPLRIPSFNPSNGFGNHFLYYNNLRQIAAKRNVEWYAPQHRIFEELFEDQLWRVSVDDRVEDMKIMLGGQFWRTYHIPTRDIFRFKDKYKNKSAKKTCAIHFRGGDFASWNREAIMKFDYYFHAIRHMQTQGFKKFVFFTDDPRHTTALQICDFLVKEQEDNGIEALIAGNSRATEVTDFAMMAHCGAIISSPSTYSIAAGMCGEDKYIVHNKEWVERQAQKDDEFWTGLMCYRNNSSYKMDHWV